MSLYYFAALIFQAVPSLSEPLPSKPTSWICPFDYISTSVPAAQWLSLLTACLAPLVIHIAAGVPSPTIIGGNESLEKPPWSERLPHFNPSSILWRYYAIADRRWRSKSWSREDLAATNALFWDGERWDGSEVIMARSRNFPSKLPNSTHVDFLSGSTLATITMTIQGAYSIFIVVTNSSMSNLADFFAPLAVIGLFRLQSAFWLSDEGAYLPFNNWDGPIMTTPFEARVSEELYSAWGWRGVIFRSWWICSMAGLAGYALHSCIGDLPTTWAPDVCYYASNILERVFYTVLTVGAFTIHSFYVLRGQSRTTLIPCIQTMWYKIYTYLLILLALLGIAFSIVETGLGWFPLYDKGV
ncbi:hypothetical protein BGZ57DRAFT_835812 [Hyaloscypha finlandica]|nr:hypothetical protein BGZ57DRAFT_835812 [Hyaloscypha finlandica]